MNLIEQIKVNDTSIDGYQGTYYDDNLEYVQVTTDADGKILEGIKYDGSKHIASDLQVDGNIINDGIQETLDTAVKEMQEEVNEILEELEESSEVLSCLDVIDNPEFIQLTTDAEERVISGRGSDGVLQENAGIKTPNLNVRHVTTDTISGKSANIDTLTLDTLNLSEEGIEKLSEDLGSGKDLDAEIEKNIEVASGALTAFGNYESEMMASPIIQDAQLKQDYVDYKTVRRTYVPKPTGKKIVMINHDDGNIPDLRTQRKIYNKYGFHCNVCAVLKPFNSLSDARTKIENYKKFIRDGHSVGIHAILDQSYWVWDRMYDVKPDGSSNFAPLVSEIRGNNPDGTGTNTFGATITADTKMSDIYTFSYLTVSDELKNKKVVEITQSELDIINQQYLYYTDAYLYNGIEDLDIDVLTAEEAASVSKTRLAWLEYYFNGLIDNTLGYSSTANTLLERFEEDYSVPSRASVSDYYPDAAHILNGKMIYWDDTTNAHYSEAKIKTESGFSDSDYQLVGKFIKGFYKDCFSTCNWEVLGRCIETAQAFFRKYYGLENFTDHHMHGVGYVAFPYREGNYVYLDRGHNILNTENAKFYCSNLGVKMSLIDILSQYGVDILEMFSGIDATKVININGTKGAYYGQKDIKQSLKGFNDWTSDSFNCFVDYLNSIGVGNTGTEFLDYSTFNTFMDGLDTNWLKFFYENAGNNVTRNGVTLKVYPHLKRIINCIIRTEGTEMVPVISVDTLPRNPAIALSVELLSRFCKNNGYEIVSLADGKNRILSMERNMTGNLFPNPSFKQTILEYFGGVSSSKDAYVPDGWWTSIGNNEIEILNETIEGISYKVMNLVKQDISFNMSTRMYGLKGGKYKLSFKLKGGENSEVSISSIKNGHFIGQSTLISRINASPTWEDKEIEFSIREPYRKNIDENNPLSIICGGYEDNICYIGISLSVADTISIANISLNYIS